MRANGVLIAHSPAICGANEFVLDLHSRFGFTQLAIDPVNFWPQH